MLIYQNSVDVLKENSISKKQEILNSHKVIGHISLTTGICLSIIYTVELYELNVI
jgi:hypothetical protein